jgi:pSer/pThr/pTyr-binding forkhead associated (FHA) protein
MNSNLDNKDHRLQTKTIPKSTTILKNPDLQDFSPRKVPVCIRFMFSDGTRIDATARRYILLGRQDNDNGQQIDIDFGQLGGREHGVSRCHAIVSVTSHTVFIKDFNSRNGTFLNGYELHPMREYVLNDGDAVVLGRIQAQVKFIY